MDVKLPPLGEGADSGTVVNLFIKEGDQLAKDQPILELENEKAVATIPSPQAGMVSRVFVKAGDKLSVGQRILALTDSSAAAAPAAVKAPAAEKAEPKPLPEEAAPPRQESAEEPQPEQARADLTPAAAPSIRKLARDLGIDLTRIRGSARGGRILLED